MIVKVCGMREDSNIQALESLDVDYMGVIFYDQSKRYVSEDINEKISAERVGVFVNADFGFIQKKITQYDLQAIQLHGDETPLHCSELRQLVGKNIKIFKAFRVDAGLKKEHVELYDPFVDMYILDSAGKAYGGNGVKWNYDLLKNLNISKSFLLSGGIDDTIPLEELVAIHPMCVGVDLNSKFEISPGIKDMGKLKRFLKSV